MQALIHHPHILRVPSPSSSSSSHYIFYTHPLMATTTSLAFSSISLHNRNHKRTTFFNGSAASCNRIGVRRSLARSGVFMSVSVGKHTAVTVDDALFADYKPTNAFLFPGQVCVFIFVACNFWVFILIFDALWIHYERRKIIFC